MRLQVLVLVLVVLSWQHGHAPWASACQSVVGVAGSSARGTAPLLQHRVVHLAAVEIGDLSLESQRLARSSLISPGQV